MTLPDSAEKLEGLELVSCKELPGQWVDNYLNEITDPLAMAPDTKLESWRCEYPSENGRLGLCITGVGQDQVARYRDVLKIALATVVEDDGAADDEDGVAEEDDSITEATEGTAAEETNNTDGARALPDIAVQVDRTSAAFADTYYATLLRTFPDRILVTIEPEIVADSEGQVPSVAFRIDPPIGAGQVHHYRAKRQTGAAANVTASSGAVTLEMWIWRTGLNNVAERDPVDSRVATAGTADPRASIETSSGVRNSFDISVTGNRNNSGYELSGWVRE